MLRLGRHIERADMTSRVLDVRAVALLAQPATTTRCAATTRCSGPRCCARCPALQAYHRRRARAGRRATRRWRSCSATPTSPARSPTAWPRSRRWPPGCPGPRPSTSPPGRPCARWWRWPTPRSTPPRRLDEVQEALAARPRRGWRPRTSRHLPDEPARRRATTGSVPARRLGQSRIYDAVDVCSRAGTGYRGPRSRSRPGGRPDGALAPRVGPAWRPSGPPRVRDELSPPPASRRPADGGRGRQRRAPRGRRRDAAPLAHRRRAARHGRGHVGDAGRRAGAERAEVLLDAVTADLHGPRRLLQAGVIPRRGARGHTTRWRSAWCAEPRRAAVRGRRRRGVDAEGRAGSWPTSPTSRAATATRCSPGPSAPGSCRRTHPRVGLSPTGRTPRRCGRCSPPPPRPAIQPPRRGRDRFARRPRLRRGLVPRHPARLRPGREGDVAVRDGRVWLRSLDGLEQVDVLLRRVPETALDPVEDAAYTAPASPAPSRSNGRTGWPSSTRTARAWRRRRPAAVPRRGRPVPDRPAPRPAVRAHAVVRRPRPAPGGRVRPRALRAARHRPADARGARGRRRPVRRGPGGLAGAHRGPTRALRRPRGRQRGDGAPPGGRRAPPRFPWCCGPRSRSPPTDRWRCPVVTPACSTAAPRSPGGPQAPARTCGCSTPTAETAGRGRGRRPCPRSTCAGRCRPVPRRRCTGRVAWPSGPRWPPGPRWSH